MGLEDTSYITYKGKRKQKESKPIYSMVLYTYVKSFIIDINNNFNKQLSHTLIVNTIILSYKQHSNIFRNKLT